MRANKSSAPPFIKELKMNLREKAIEYLPYCLAYDTIGIYPQSVKGGPCAYEKRTERMEGHNEALTEYINNVCTISAYLGRINSREVEDALLNEDIFVHVEDKKVELIVNCNDVFYWACSDSEEIKPEEIKDLVECLKLTEYGSMLWVCRKRKMRPQKPWYNDFTEEEKALFDACGPERENE
jgi:hypothetical protein